MEMYLYILAGIVIGVLCANLIRPKRKAKNETVGDIVPNTSKQELIDARKEIKRITASAEHLKSELQQAQQRLKENEENILSHADDQTKVLIRQKEDENKASVKALSDQIEAQQKELKSLKRKVEDLEDDVEDAEDDKKSAEKKLKRQEENYNKLFDEMQHAQLELQRLKGVEEKYTDSEARSEKRKAAIDFISNILTAEAVVAEYDNMERSSSSINKVNQIAKFIKDDYSQLMNENGYDNKQEREKELERFISEKKKTWIHGKTTVAFIGEFSSGKTSIVNRILLSGNEKALKLPVSTKATTAIPTYISSRTDKTRDSYTFIAPDESQKRIADEKMIEMMSKETLDEVRGMDQLIKYVVRKENNRSLTDISILDTPGFSSNDAKDKERTLEVVNECDALFWVVDVNSGTINQSSLAVIKKELKKPLYIVVNKVDSKAKSEVDKVVCKIEETLANKGVPCQGIIRFSMKEDIKQIMNVIRDVKRNKPVDDYFKSTREGLNDLAKNFRKQYDTAYEVRNGYIESMRKDKDTIAQIWDKIRDLNEAILNIPNFKKGGLFSSDRYEMTVFQAEQLVEMIRRIIDQTDADSEISKMIRQIESLEQNAYEYGKASMKMSELSKKGTRINDSQEQFNKLINDLNR